MEDSEVLVKRCDGLRIRCDELSRELAFMRMDRDRYKAMFKSLLFFFVLVGVYEVLRAYSLASAFHS